MTLSAVAVVRRPGNPAPAVLGGTTEQEAGTRDKLVVFAFQCVLDMEDC